MITHQTVELRDGALVARVADVPDLDAALAARVHVSRGVADRHGAHHLPVVEGVDLASVSGDPRSDEGVGGEGDGLHLAVCTNMEGVCSKAVRRRKDRQGECKKCTSLSSVMK